MVEVHKCNQRVVDRYPDIVVYSFTQGGACPNCLSELTLNQFDNYQCIKCWEDWIYKKKRNYPEGGLSNDG